jgi:hypothetical protein
VGNPIGEKRLTDEMTEALVEKGWKVAPEAEADAQLQKASDKLFKDFPPGSAKKK